jgi:hypothetical protein
MNPLSPYVAVVKVVVVVAGVLTLASFLGVDLTAHAADLLGLNDPLSWFGL